MKLVALQRCPRELVCPFYHVRTQLKYAIFEAKSKPSPDAESDGALTLGFLSMSNEDNAVIYR